MAKVSKLPVVNLILPPRQMKEHLKQWIPAKQKYWLPKPWPESNISEPKYLKGVAIFNLNFYIDQLSQSDGFYPAEPSEILPKVSHLWQVLNEQTTIRDALEKIFLSQKEPDKFRERYDPNCWPSEITKLDLLTCLKDLENLINQLPDYE